MQILVLGGTRFVGPYVVRELTSSGHDVTVFHRGKTEADLPVAVWHLHADFADLRSVTADPEVVLDMVPFRREDGRRILLFKGVAQRGVVLSSCDVYQVFGRIWGTEPGPPQSERLTEDSPLRTRVIDEEYDKVGVEEEARADSDFPVTVIRLPAVHGPGDYQHRLYDYVRRMDDDRPAILIEETEAAWRWSRGYVEDVAHAVALAATDERATGRTYHVAEPVAANEVEWVTRLARVHGWGGRIVTVPNHELPEPMRNLVDLRHDLIVDSTRIREELGYREVVPPDETIRRTIEWEREEPPSGQPPDYAAEDAVIARFA